MSGLSQLSSEGLHLSGTMDKADRTARHYQWKRRYHTGVLHHSPKHEAGIVTCWVEGNCSDS